MALIVGCKCGKSHVVSQKPDLEYGQYYVVIKCDECGYYWEGYMGNCEDVSQEDEKFTHSVSQEGIILVPADHNPFITKYGRDFLMFRHYRLFNGESWQIEKNSLVITEEKRLIVELLLFGE